MARTRSRPPQLASVDPHQWGRIEINAKADDEDDEGEYVDRRSIPVASHQDRSAQRFETMQKAKAQAMASGRSVKC